MFNGIALYISLMLLFVWAGTQGRLWLAKFGMLTDIVIHVACQWLLGGHNDGRIAVLFGCLLFSLTLMVYRKVNQKRIQELSIT